MRVPVRRWAAVAARTAVLPATPAPPGPDVDAAMPPRGHVVRTGVVLSAARASPTTEDVTS